MILSWVLFLSLFSTFFAWQQLEHWQMTQGWTTVYLKYCQRQQAAEEESCLALFSERNDFSGRGHREGSSSAQSSPLPAKESPPVVHLTLVPYSACLNLALLIKTPLESKPLFRRLLEVLYGHAPFFDAHLADRWVDALWEQLAKRPLKDTEELVTLDFKEEALQDFFYQMMAGAMGAENPSHRYLSLLEVLIYEPQRRKKKVDIHHVALPVLEALFGKEAACALFEERRALYQQGMRTLKGKKSVFVSSLFLTEERVASMMNGYGVKEALWREWLDFQTRKPTQGMLIHPKGDPCGLFNRWYQTGE